MLQVKVLRSLVVVIAVVAKLETYALTEIVEVVAIYRSILLQRVCGSSSSSSHFFSRRKEKCTRTMGHEVGIVTLVASRVEGLFVSSTN